MRTETPMRKRWILPIFISILLTHSAFGQEKSVDPEKAENLRRLMKLVGVEKLQQTMADQMIVALKPILQKLENGEEPTRKMLDMLSDIMREELKKTDFITMNIDLYDKYFTTDEIKGLIQFYESPVGQKAIQVLPELSQEAMKHGMEQGQVVGLTALGRLVDEFPELKNVFPAASVK